MKILQGNRIPKPLGHSSTAIISNHQLYISGQYPISLEGTMYVEDDFETQFNIVFQNIENILQSNLINLQKIVKVTVYLSDIKYYPQFNALFADFIGKHKPVRTVVPVAELQFGSKLAVDIIAETPQR